MSSERALYKMFCTIVCIHKQRQFCSEWFVLVNSKSHELCNKATVSRKVGEAPERVGTQKPDHSAVTS